MSINQISIAIIGAPRSGTTSLHSWLSAHPKIAGSEPKETYYFVDQSHPLAKDRELHDKSATDTLSQYFHQQNEKLFWVESTPYNFDQRRALILFRNMRPIPLIVALLRDPSYRLLSAFRFSRDRLGNISPNYSFDSYVKDLFSATPNRKARRYFRREVDYKVAMDGLRIGRYVEWLQRWYEQIPQEQIALYSFSAMTQQPSLTTDDICRRINLDSSFYADYSFPRLNQSNTEDKTVHETLNSATGINGGPEEDDTEVISTSLNELFEYFSEWNKRLKDEYRLTL